MLAFVGINYGSENVINGHKFSFHLYSHSLFSYILKTIYTTHIKVLNYSVLIYTILSISSSSKYLVLDCASLEIYDYGEAKNSLINYAYKSRYIYCILIKCHFRNIY